MITQDAINNFAELSGDDNPIHMNNLYAHASPFGGTIVHGILLFLTGIEDNLNFKNKIRFKHVECNFLHFINNCEKFTYLHSDSSLKIISKGIICVDIKYDTTEDNEDNKPVDFIPEDTLYKNEKYDLLLRVNNSILKKLFPNIYDNFNLLQIFQIINLSRFVGKIFLLNSIFGSFKINFEKETTRISLFPIKSDFDGKYIFCIKGCMNGEIVVYKRQEKVINNTFFTIEPTKFLNYKVLVIGGSRGIGNVISKIYSKGGAEVVITYNKIKPVCELETVQFDIHDDIPISLQNRFFTHIFYMVTPHIKNTKIFSEELYKEYYFYFVKKFKDIIDYFKPSFTFYPSSTSIGTEIYKEYNKAKEDGEKMIKSMGYKIHIERLPRLLTDQTNTLVNESTQDPLKYMLKILDNKKRIKLYLLCNSNIDFIYRGLIDEFDVSYTPYGQLQQTLIQGIKEEYDHLIVLNTIEDILGEQFIFSSKEEYKNIFLSYIEKIKKLSPSFVVNFFQRIQSPFDETYKKFSIDEFNYISEKEFSKKILDITKVDLQKFNLSSYIDGKYCFSIDLSEYIQKHIKGRLSIEFIKCLIVDLDNTLWEGVISEDDVYITEGHQLFQKILKEYKNKGVILCINSKNDLNKVQDAFKDKNCILTLDDFTIIKVNWNRKSDNIKDICKQLNISEKHTLFIDDSKIEQEEVRQNCECKILEIDKKDPLEYIKLLQKNPWLYNNFVSENQTELYKIKEQVDKSRKKISISESRIGESRIEDFYYSLNTTINFEKINESSFTRAFQLLLKTNQFNLNKIAYKEEEFRLIKDSSFIVSYTDKFTKFDQIGVILLRENTEFIEIENIVLSCRVFNRDFETCIMVFLKNYAFNKNKKLKGCYIETDKNKKFKNIYKDYGFDEEMFFIPVRILEYPKWFKVGINETSEMGVSETPASEPPENNLEKEIREIINSPTDKFESIENFNSLYMMLIIENKKKGYRC